MILQYMNTQVLAPKAITSYPTTTYPGEVASDTVPYYGFLKKDYPNLVLDLGTQGAFGNAESLYINRSRWSIYSAF